jgi:glycerol-1-phosphate dehydrogenase [NAD(P)+]
LPRQNDTIAVIPQNLNDLANFSTLCSCGRNHTIDTEIFIVEPGALFHITEVVRSYFGSSQKIGLLADSTTYSAAGETVEKTLVKSGFNVSRFIVPDGPGGRPHATFTSTLLAEEQLKGADLIIAAGSGTINDLGKLASFRLGIPYITVPTAASMNGYTSSIAAIMKDGLKQTVNCHQAAAVVADIDIISSAPLHLSQSGLGDLESKPVSTADFKLSSLLKKTYYCSAPGDLVTKAEAEAAEYAKGIKEGSREAVEALTNALLLSGCSMKLAGSSSPASGGEHLISHHWDMTAAGENRIEGWHGAQVGVASIVMAQLYEQLQQIDPEQIDIDRLAAVRPTVSQLKHQIVKRHGAWGEQAYLEFSKKYQHETGYKKELKYIVSNWKSIWKDLSMLKPATRIRNILMNAGAPVTVKALGLTPDHLYNSFIAAREIRGRFTVLDFAADIGQLHNIRNLVIEKSGCTG